MQAVCFRKCPLPTGHSRSKEGKEMEARRAVTVEGQVTACRRERRVRNRSGGLSRPSSFAESFKSKELEIKETMRAGCKCHAFRTRQRKREIARQTRTEGQGQACPWPCSAFVRSRTFSREMLFIVQASNPCS